MATSFRRPPVAFLPADRAFVLQIDADADLAAGRLGGRVEHVVSGRAARFGSLPQLLAFLGRATGASAGRAKEPAPGARPRARRSQTKTDAPPRRHRLPRGDGDDDGSS